MEQETNILKTSYNGRTELLSSLPVNIIKSYENNLKTIENEKNIQNIKQIEDILRWTSPIKFCDGVNL